MKKLISILLAGALLLLLGGMTLAEEVDYSGYWRLTGADVAGIQIGQDKLWMTDWRLMRLHLLASSPDAGLAYYLIRSDDQDQEGRWVRTEDGVCVITETGTYEFVYQELIQTINTGRGEAHHTVKMLTMEQDGILFMLTRSIYDPAVPVDEEFTGDEYYDGTWLLTGMESDDEQMGPRMLKQAGYDVTITLNTDITAEMNVGGENRTGHWVPTADGVMLIDETGKYEFVYQDEMLTMEQDGMLWMLTAEGDEPAIWEEPVVMAGVAPAAFEGCWKLWKAKTRDGREVPPQVNRESMELILFQGKALVESDGFSWIGVQEASYVVKEAEGVGTVCVITGQNQKTGETVELMRLNMLDDGRLVWDRTEEVVDFPLYWPAEYFFEREDAE